MDLIELLFFMILELIILYPKLLWRLFFVGFFFSYKTFYIKHDVYIYTRLVSIHDVYMMYTTRLFISIHDVYIQDLYTSWKQMLLLGIPWKPWTFLLLLRIRTVILLIWDILAILSQSPKYSLYIMIGSCICSNGHWLFSYRSGICDCFLWQGTNLSSSSHSPC